MINITVEQYRAIRALKDFAQWYINEHEGGSGSEEMIKQWELDRDEVEKGLKALAEVDQQLKTGE